MRNVPAVPALLTCAALLASAASASAETLFGVTDPAAGASVLVSFDSATPGSETAIGTVTGIVAGQTLRGIDFRPSNGLLYGLSSSGAAAQLYTINTATGAATAVGSGLTLTGNTSTRVSLDFNPMADALRVVTGGGNSYRVNAGTGALIAQDTTLNPVGTLVSGIAYTNNNPGATQTTLYAYDWNADNLITIGGVNGTPSPNTGAVSVVGSTGVVAFEAAMGFDISGATGFAYLALDDNDTATDDSEFYRINLGSGAVTFAGQFDRDLLDISVTPIPEPSQLALLLAGAGIVGAAVRRRKTNA